MPAMIDTEFNRGFILNEENLTKIDDIIKKRFNFCDDIPKLDYKVYRSDDAVIDYSTTSEVSNEENANRNKIRTISIKCSYHDNELVLIFTKGQKSRLFVAFDDKDKALLLTADLKEYLKSEVLLQKWSFLIKAAENRLLIPIAIILVMMVSVTLTIGSFTSLAEIDLASASIEQKIDFLINSRRQFDNSRFGFIALAPFIAVLSIFVVSLSANSIYPTDVFYIGKEMQKYDDQKKLRGNIFWIVIVGLLVSLIGSYVYNIS